MHHPRIELIEAARKGDVEKFKMIVDFCEKMFLFGMCSEYEFWRLEALSAALDNGHEEIAKLIEREMAK